jgi:hypothetical protein
MRQTIFLLQFKADRVEGDFGNLTIPSVTDWLEKNPPFKWGAIAATVMGVATILAGWRPGNHV